MFVRQGWYFLENLVSLEKVKNFVGLEKSGNFDTSRGIFWKLQIELTFYQNVFWQNIMQLLFMYTYSL